MEPIRDTLKVGMTEGVDESGYYYIKNWYINDPMILDVADIECVGVAVFADGEEPSRVEPRVNLNQIATRVPGELGLGFASGGAIHLLVPVVIRLVVQDEV